MVMWQGDRIKRTCKRFDIPGQAHELTFSCYRNQNFLSVDRTCRWLAESITAARGRLDFSLWGYVFMPNHVHLLIRPRRQSYSISDILGAIKEPVGRNAVAYLKANNLPCLDQLATNERPRRYRFWQKGGGYDRNIDRLETLIGCLEYIHNNPVRKGLVERPDQWRYSSAGEWLNRTPGLIAIDKDDWPAFV
jgi:putative transposase